MSPTACAVRRADEIMTMPSLSKLSLRLKIARVCVDRRLRCPHILFGLTDLPLGLADVVCCMPSACMMRYESQTRSAWATSREPAQHTQLLGGGTLCSYGLVVQFVMPGTMSQGLV